MIKKLVYLILLVVFFIAGWVVKSLPALLKPQTENVEILKKIDIRPLDAYTIENLSDTAIEPGNLLIIEEVSDEDKFKSYKFEFSFKPNPTKNNIKKTTGQINIPKENAMKAVILMIRGFVSQEIYTTGMGTKRASEYFASEGFITIAPDFLGYGESDIEAENIFESRFQTYTTVLSLLSTIENLKQNPQKLTVPEGNQALFNSSQPLFIWAHSNGGQIALTVLEITKKSYPTTLWAPVTKSFPYSILYYTDESADKGKLIRNELSKFEQIYDVEKYSIDNYFDNINAPIQLHQGTFDDAVPVNWNIDFSEELEFLDKEVTFFIYPGADHNMNPDWNVVVERDKVFFEKIIEQNLP